MLRVAVNSSEIQALETVANPAVPLKDGTTDRCILCGSEIGILLSNVVDNRLGTPGAYQIRRCIRCSFTQTSPIPSAERLKELYRAHYNFGGEQNTLYTRLRDRFLASYAYRLWTQWDGDVSFHTRRGKGSLLDIGCNEGRGLRIYSANGFQVEGLELNETAAAVARDAGFQVHTVLLQDFHPADTYDVAVLANVLEHSLNPRQMLLDVHRLLNKTGHVWISCPNRESWLRNVFGRAWINWHVPFHISHFSPETLRQLLWETGYRAIEIRQVTPAQWAAQSVIAYLFSKEGQRTQQLRNPFLILSLMIFIRVLLFPWLWLGNRRGQGDCLVVTATKP